MFFIQWGYTSSPVSLQAYMTFSEWIDALYVIFLVYSYNDYYTVFQRIIIYAPNNWQNSPPSRLYTVIYRIDWNILMQYSSTIPILTDGWIKSFSKAIICLNGCLPWCNRSMAIIHVLWWCCHSEWWQYTMNGDRTMYSFVKLQVKLTETKIYKQYFDLKCKLQEI